MINPTGKKLEKLLFGIFDHSIEGIDRYNHNGSLWLIFTDEMRWVVEYTKEQTLWYNFNFFKNEMEIVGLDCVDNKDLIQKWFESRFLNINPVEHTIQNGVKGTQESYTKRNPQVDDTIQNGVRHTVIRGENNDFKVEDTIQNGVKETKRPLLPRTKKVEDAIKNGVKHTSELDCQSKGVVEDTIQNGVKETIKGIGIPSSKVDDAIQYGVKETKGTLRRTLLGVGDIIQNGVKEVKESDFYRISRIMDVTQNGVKHCEDGDRLDGDERFEDIIQNGVKEMQPLPAQDGNRDWGNYYRGKEDRSKPFNEYLFDAIRFGVKEIHDDCSNNIGRVEGIIRVGEKLN